MSDDTTEPEIDDVEGHKHVGAPEQGFRPRVDDEDDDVEGHMKVASRVGVKSGALDGQDDSGPMSAHSR